MANVHRDYSEFFDWQLFGMLMRKKRRMAGYERADDFADAVREATGADIPGQTIYRIEQGKQEPSPTMLMAFFLTLGCTLDDFEAYFRICASPEWMDARIA